MWFRFLAQVSTSSGNGRRPETVPVPGRKKSEITVSPVVTSLTCLGAISSSVPVEPFRVVKPLFMLIFWLNLFFRPGI